MKKRTAVSAFVMCLCSLFSIAQQTTPSQGVATTKKAAPAISKAVKSASATVLISTDMDCMIKIDSGDAKSLSVDKVIPVKMAPGEHLLVATSVDGRDVWKQVVKVDKPVQKVVVVALLAAKQAREQDQSAKKELEDAQNQEQADQAQAAKVKEERARQQEQRANEEASRRQAAEQKRKQIADLRSQISDLQGQVDEAEDQARQDEDSARQADENCARLQLQPGIPCVAQITGNVARQEARRLHQQATELKEQIRDLQRQIEDIQNQ